MTTRVIIENGNEPDVRDWNVHVTEVNSLGDPGTVHVLRPGDSNEFWIHDAQGLRIEEKEADAEGKAEVVGEEDDPATDESPPDPAPDEGGDNVSSQSTEADQAGAADEKEEAASQGYNEESEEVGGRPVESDRL